MTPATEPDRSNSECVIVINARCTAENAVTIRITSAIGEDEPEITVARNLEDTLNYVRRQLVGICMAEGNS